MKSIKQFGISMMALVALVALSACGNSAPTATPSASPSSSESQAPIARTPRADAQVLVVQACDAYDTNYEKMRKRYGKDAVGFDSNGNLYDHRSFATFYAKIRPVWDPLARAALEDPRWSEALTDLNFFFQVDSGNVAIGGAVPDAVYNSSEQARMGFFSSCQIARSVSRVDLDR